MSETIRKSWLLALGIPPEWEHTYDWEEHPEGHDQPCACRTCRSYAAEEADEENAALGVG